MAEQFNKCPQCKSTNIENADYEDSDTPEVRCTDCDWEGFMDALVSE